MVLGDHKESVLNSLKNCIERNLFPKASLEARIALMPIMYEDVNQEEVDNLLGLINQDTQDTQVTEEGE